MRLIAKLGVVTGIIVLSLSGCNNKTEIATESTISETLEDDTTETLEDDTTETLEDDTTETLEDDTTETLEDSSKNFYVENKDGLNGQFAKFKCNIPAGYNYYGYTEAEDTGFNISAFADGNNNIISIIDTDISGMLNDNFTAADLMEQYRSMLDEEYNGWIIGTRKAVDSDITLALKMATDKILVIIECSDKDIVNGLIDSYEFNGKDSAFDLELDKSIIQ